MMSQESKNKLDHNCLNCFSLGPLLIVTNGTEGSRVNAKLFLCHLPDIEEPMYPTSAKINPYF